MCAIPRLCWQPISWTAKYKKRYHKGVHSQSMPVAKVPLTDRHKGSQKVAAFIRTPVVHKFCHAISNFMLQGTNLDDEI